MDALRSNHKWDIIPPAPNANIFGCIWLYFHKFDICGRLDLHNGHLVPRGFFQHPGLDVDFIFSHVVKHATIRTILSIVISRYWIIHQLDVKNAFLHGNLSKKFYMKQPSGYVNPHHLDYLCWLCKALYGLKQVPHAWYQHLTNRKKKQNVCKMKNNQSNIIM